MTVRPVTVGLLGMYGSANLGDTAIQKVVMAELRERRPDVVFVGLSSSPEDVARTFDMPGFPASGLGRAVYPGEVPRADPLPGRGRLAAARNIFRATRGLDMVVLSGGGQLEDFWGGPWAHPFRLLVWAMSARFRNRGLAALGVGVDELRRPLSEHFVRTAMGLAGVRYFRDEDSRARICDGKRFSMVGRVAADPTFGLNRPSPESQRDDVSEQQPFSVLSPISFSAFGGVNREAYDAYLRALAATGDALARQGLRVRLVCSETRMDPPVAQQVVELMAERGAVERPRIAEVDDFLAAVGGARLVVASRLHSIVLSTVAGCPVVAVSPTRKATRQMVDLELQEWCLDMDGLDANRLIDVTRRAAEEHRTLRQEVARRVESLRAGLKDAFDELAAAIPRETSARRTLVAGQFPIPSSAR